MEKSYWNSPSWWDDNVKNITESYETIKINGSNYGVLKNASWNIKVDWNNHGTMQNSSWNNKVWWGNTWSMISMSWDNKIWWANRWIINSSSGSNTIDGHNEKDISSTSGETTIELDNQWTVFSTSGSVHIWDNNLWVINTTSGTVKIWKLNSGKIITTSGTITVKNNTGILSSTSWKIKIKDKDIKLERVWGNYLNIISNKNSNVIMWTISNVGSISIGSNQVIVNGKQVTWSGINHNEVHLKCPDLNIIIDLDNKTVVQNGKILNCELLGSIEKYTLGNHDLIFLHDSWRINYNGQLITFDKKLMSIDGTWWVQ